MTKEAKTYYGHIEGFVQPDAVALPPVTPNVLRRRHTDPKNQPGVNDVMPAHAPSDTQALSARMAAMARMISDLALLEERVTDKRAEINREREGIARQLVALEI